MKNNLLPLRSLSFLMLISITSCSKTNDAIDSELTAQNVQTAIVGSWQFVEKGVDVAMHDGHICSDPQNMAQDKITYVVQWEKVASEEKRQFKPNGDYNTYVKTTLTCQGNYKVADSGVLEMNTNCENAISKIEKVPATYLIMRQGNNYFKYLKLD